MCYLLNVPNLVNIMQYPIFLSLSVMVVRLAGYLDMTGIGLGPYSYCIKEKKSSSIMTKLLYTCHISLFSKNMSYADSSF